MCAGEDKWIATLRDGHSLTNDCASCVMLNRESPHSSGSSPSAKTTDPRVQVETSDLDAFASAQSFGNLSVEGDSCAESPAAGEDPLDFFGSPAYSASVYRAPEGISDDIAKLDLDDCIGLFDAVSQNQREASSVLPDDFPATESKNSKAEVFDDVGLFDMPPASEDNELPHNLDTPSSVEHHDVPHYEDLYGEVDDAVIRLGRGRGAAKNSTEEKSASRLKVEDYRGEGMEDGPPPYEEAVQSHSSHDSACYNQQSSLQSGGGFANTRPRSTNEKMKSAFSAVKKLSAKVKNEAEKRFDKHMKSWRTTSEKSSKQRVEELRTIAKQIQSISLEDRDAALMAMDEADRVSVMRYLNADVSSHNVASNTVHARSRNPPNRTQRELVERIPSRSYSTSDVHVQNRTVSNFSQTNTADTDQEADLTNDANGGRGEGSMAKKSSHLDSVFTINSSTSVHTEQEFFVGGGPSQGKPNAPNREELKAQREARVQARISEKMAEKQSWDREEKEKREAREDASTRLGSDLKAWSHRSRGNIRALLGSLDKVLWESCGWKPINMMDLVDASSVKKQYRKAITVVHPDKVRQRGATAEQEYIADIVFDSLKEAYGKFEQGELRGGSTSYQPVFM